jgi:hypothetical protein
MKQNTISMAKQTKKPHQQNQALPVSNEVIGALADEFQKDPLTIKRWVLAKDIRLTTDKAKKVFAEKNIEWS